MQGFDQRLDDIIFRYHLDVFYPGYRKMRQAEKYLNEMWVHSPPLGAQGNFNRKERHDTM